SIVLRSGTAAGRAVRTPKIYEVAPSYVDQDPRSRRERLNLQPGLPPAMNLLQSAIRPNSGRGPFVATRSVGASGFQKSVSRPTYRKPAVRSPGTRLGGAAHGCPVRSVRPGSPAAK